MKYKISMVKEQEEDIVVYAKEASPVLEKIQALLGELDKTVFGYRNSGVVKLDADAIYCFFTEEARVYALTREGKLWIKERLYRVEQTFGETFVRIHQSCLVNVSKIRRFDTSIGGALMVTLENGYTDYVSRRQLKTVKERIGF